MIKLSIWGALIVLASHVNASGESSSLNVVMTGTKSFDLSMDNVKGNVQLFLKNKKNQLIYEKTFNNNESLVQSFDMNLFKDGTYIMHLADSQKTLSFTISIENDILNIDPEKQKTQFLPVVTQQENMVSVNMLALSEELLSIRVLNPENEVVHRKTLKGTGNLGQIYDFSKSQQGNYTFQVVTGGKKISKEIAIK
jgi:hypothetical protein